MTKEELQHKWDNDLLTPEEEVEALMVLFGMDREQAEQIALEHWREEKPDDPTGNIDGQQ